MSEQLFQKATRRKWRFERVTGQLISAEGLWDFPLTGNDGDNLDGIAKKLAKQIKETSEESFVEENTSENKTAVEKLEIVKAVIQYKKDQAAKARRRKSLAEQKQKYLELIANKQDEQLKSKSMDELMKEFSELEKEELDED